MSISKEYKYFIVSESKNDKLLDSEKPNIILKTFIKYTENYLGIKEDVRVMMGRVKKGLDAYIDIAKISKSNKSDMILKIRKDMYFPLVLKFIAHEFTHAKQIFDDDLWYSNTHIEWKGKEFITLKELEKISRKANTDKGFEMYKSLPWEVEAYRNGDLIVDMFKKSQEFKKLKEMNDITINLYLDLLT